MLNRHIFNLYIFLLERHSVSPGFLDDCFLHKVGKVVSPLQTVTLVSSCTEITADQIPRFVVLPITPLVVHVNSLHHLWQRETRLQGSRKLFELHLQV